MSDVLTSLEKMALSEALKMLPRASEAEPAVRSIIDRLCARIEKLEAVAVQARMAKRFLGSKPFDDSDADAIYCELGDALAALNHPEAPDRTEVGR